MKLVHAFALAAPALLMSACATTPSQGPIEVTRYHLGTPIAANTVVAEPLSSSDRISPEYQIYLDAVLRQLGQLGYTRAPDNGTSAYIAGVSFRRVNQGAVRSGSPVSIGLGGGSFGRGGGVGAGIGFGLGGRQRDAITWELAVQLRRRSDSTVVWEGRAQSQSLEAPGEIPAQQNADRLAQALFRDFPGESGITTRVK